MNKKVLIALASGSLVVLGLIIFVFGRTKESAEAKEGYKKLVAAEESVSVETVEQEIATIDAAKQAAAEKAAKKAQKEQQQATQPKSIKRRFRNAVVLGDSIVEGLSSYGTLYKNSVVFHRGWSVDEAAQLVTTTINIKPQVVFFQFGINDMLYFRGETAPFINGYKKLIRRVQKALPATRIYVNSVLPVKKSTIRHDKRYGSWSDYNVGIQQMCAEMGITYIDNGYLITDNSIYAEDGLHVKSSFYPQWAANMAEKGGL